MSKVLASLVVVLLMAAGVVAYGVFVLNEENNENTNTTNGDATIDSLHVDNMKVLVSDDVVGIIQFDLYQEYGETTLECTQMKQNYTNWQIMTNPPFTLKKDDMKRIRIERRSAGIIVSEAELATMPFIFVFDNGLTYTVNITNYEYM